MSKEFESAHRLYQDGQIVAAAYGERSSAEIAHYAVMYGQDGPVEIVERKSNGRWPRVK